MSESHLTRFRPKTQRMFQLFYQRLGLTVGHYTSMIISLVFDLTLSKERNELHIVCEVN